MNLFDVDYNRYKKYAILAFSKVFGDEYKDIIQNRINKSIIIPYMTPNGIHAYVSFLKECKTRELYIEFLREIGVDVIKYIPNTYAVNLDEELLKTLKKVLDNKLYFCNSNNRYSPIHSFDKKNEIISNVLLERKLSIINFILGDSQTVTKETLDEFIKSERFSEVKDKIKEYDKVYKKLLRRYKRFCKKLDIYENYYNEETEKYNDILKRKTDEFLDDLIDILPQNIKELIIDKSSERQKYILINPNGILKPTFIECFSLSEFYKLRSQDIDWIEKYIIISSQLSFLEDIGIDVPDSSVFINEEEDKIDNYFKFINQENIKKYLPSEEIINCIIKKRNNKYEEAIKEYIFNCDEYKKVFSLLGGDERNIDAIFDIFKNIRICVCGATQIINNHFDLISLMFYTFRAGDLGTQFYAFMHECGHIIENNENGFGFDIDFYSTVNDDKNPYNNSRRKYELFNETINDIFTIEAVEILHKLNIFPIEKKEYTITDLSNVNTSILSKQILYPLVNNYRSQLIKAKITSKIEELTEYIGVDNFENLVDIVNRVEYLVGLGLLTDLENNQVNDNVNEYYSILERVENIYNNIDSSYTRFKLTK